MKIAYFQSQNITPDTVELSFQTKPDFSFRAGQFIDILLPDINDPRGKHREFSLVSNPKELPIAKIAFKKSDSPFKQRLINLQSGEEIEALGPYGDFELPSNLSRTYFIAGGIGITPAHSMITDLDNKKAGQPVTLIHIDSSEEFPYKDSLLKARQSLSQLNLHFLNERLGAAELSSLIPDINQSRFYISGPVKMVVDTKKSLETLGIQSDQIFTDEFVGY